jgi:hypothetical protein
MKMQFAAATPEMYRQELAKHFSRMSAYEIRQKSLGLDLQEVYGRRAQYRVPRGPYKTPFSIPITIYFVINEGIEYDLPHTLGQIIILPVHLEYSRDLSKIICHELVHIYFRIFSTTTVADFCGYKNIVRLRRNRMSAEITNPDVYYYSGLMYGKNSAIFVALEDIGAGLEKRYYVAGPNFCRKASVAEIYYYDLCLPYSQNDHPEEMIAEMLASLYFKK